MNKIANRATTNRFAFDHEPANDHDGLLTIAERELAAFFTAVTELFGSEQARLTAEEWFGRVDLSERLPKYTIRDWRQVIVAVLARLASRLNSSSKSIKSSSPAALS